MSDTTIRITDNSNLVGAAFDKAIERALLNIGLEAERRAVIKITENKSIDTGLLRNSIAFAIGGEKASKDEYQADKGTIIKDENGETQEVVKTGKYTGTAPKSSPNLPTVYIGTNVSYAQYIELGVRGRDPQPFLKPAATEHSDVYKRIVEDELKNG